jgi:hypothetical protein
MHSLNALDGSRFSSIIYIGLYMLHVHVRVLSVLHTSRGSSHYISHAGREQEQSDDDTSTGVPERVGNRVVQHGVEHT